MSDSLEVQVEHARTRIKGMLKKVPPRVCNGSYDTSVAYKKTAVLAGKLADQKHPKYAAIIQACNQLATYEN